MPSTRTLPFVLALLTITAVRGQWTPLNSGITSVQSMTALNGDLFAATYPSGVKKSTNGGTAWSPVNTGLPQSGANYYVRAVGTDGTHLFAGTQDGVYRSDNSGTSWSVMNGTMPYSTTNYANKFFSFSGVTFAVFSASIANGGGIYRTDNAGTTWNIGHSGMSSNAVVYHLTLVGGTIYASSNVGLWTSIDQGLNWTAVSSANYAVYGLASIGNRLVITSTFGYRYSTNNGSTWNDATGDPANPTDGEIVAFDGNLYALSGTSNACYRSTDNGSTWSGYNGGFSMIDAGAQEEFFVDGTTLYCSALFDIYTITGTNVGLPEEVRGNDRVGPTLTDGDLLVHLGAAPHGNAIVLVALDGREVLRWPGASVGDNHLDVSSVGMGAYRVLLERSGGDPPRLLGTVIVQ